ncbi:hypothetical protein [Microbacterium sp. C7(2022)]|uniref:hypothetical protein n=1 Tax=Microbacterium sp. C7(2022) TaxID=2992759 RepID=UPI00237B2874|nr:hypothetical protein [Microbacterium sp. C7(2022)]MDE0545610.1 hypothetical protein [Microbacterium sp. C7(2022)]
MASESGSGPDDELATLRARAYGPNADIGNDPHAQARLEELEQSTAGVASALDAPSRPGPQISLDSPLRIPSQAEPVSSARAVDGRPNVRGRIRPWMLVAAGALGVTVGVLAGGAWISAGQARADFVLAATDAEPSAALVEQINAWGTGGTNYRGYESIGDLQVWLVETEPGIHCALVVNIAAVPDESGVAGASCETQGLDPVLDVAIGAGGFFDGAMPSPDPSLPEGSVIRVFVRADAAEIWLYGDVGGEYLP